LTGTRLGFWYFKLLTNRSNERIGEFAVPRDGATMLVDRIFEDRVAAAFTHQYATMRYQMTYKVASLHGVEAVEIDSRCPA
jgi:hypothetical protein